MKTTPLLALQFIVVFFAALPRSEAIIPYHAYKRTSTVATFNTALIPIYPGPELRSRAGILAELIKRSGVDVFCLQEVWFSDIQKEIYQSVKDYYPYIVSGVDLDGSAESPDDRKTCTPEMVQQLQQCIQVGCSGATGGQLLFCIVFGCGQVFSTFPGECKRCIALSPFLPIISTECINSQASRYDKSYGLMLLSKKEVRGSVVEGFIPQNQFRGMIRTTVKDVGDVICTHLTADFGATFLETTLVTPPIYSSYGEQQYAELLRLFDLAVSSDQPVIMGDFNHGPAAPGNITWEFPFHYGLMNSRGLTSPYVTTVGQCTWCLENPVVAATFPLNEIIDHIYIPVDTVKRVVSVERIFDSVTTPAGNPLSDHYGVKMELTSYRKNCNWWESFVYFCKSANLVELPPPQRHLDQLCTASS